MTGTKADGDRRGHRTPPRRPDLDSVYCINADGSRNTIHTADVRGRYQSRKRLLWAVLIAVYVLLPWLRIGGNPAILIDIPARNFFLFGQTYKAQDFYLAFFLVSGIGFTLFVVSALFGRLWCGYGCPHTVFLEGVYRRIERWIEGGAPARKRLAEAPWGVNKVLRRGGKWLAFLAVSLGLAHTFLGYFMPVRELVQAVISPPSRHPVAFTFVWVFTAIMLFNFGWFREQLCIVICPYGRLQGVLYDADTINVGYDSGRGEPRGHHDQPERGDCIDCYRCVAVCPTGIDIRNGTQLECVGCANCIDACDEVMDKVGQPRGLIRYDSLRGLETGQRRFMRGRVVMYAVLLLIGVTVFTAFAVRRSPFEARLLRTQGPPYTLQGDLVTNSFTLHLVNKTPAAATFRLQTESRDGIDWTVPLRQVELKSLADQHLPIVVRFHRADAAAAKPLTLHIDSDAGSRDVQLTLVGPKPPP